MRDARSVAVLVPVKAFATAKLRLAPALTAPEREALARAMAEGVLAAAAPLPVAVVCDDAGVATWAEARGATVLWTPDVGLNGAVQRGFSALVAAGADLIIAAHADLPHARTLERVIDFDRITLVPDRREDGTNVLAIPATSSAFVFSYGKGSFARHLAEAGRVGTTARVLRLPDLQWDVDTPDDLPIPATS